MPLVTAASASRDPAPHAVHRVRVFIWDGKLNMVWDNHNSVARVWLRCGKRVARILQGCGKGVARGWRPDASMIQVKLSSFNMLLVTATLNLLLSDF